MLKQLADIPLPHPLSRITGREKKFVVYSSLIILLSIAAIIVIQKYYEFGSSPDYHLPGSIIFNLLTIVPFSLCIAASLAFNDIILHYRPGRYILLTAISTLVLFLLYVAGINSLLYLFGFSSSPIHAGFILKYFTGTVQIHLALYLFVLLYNIGLYRNASRKSHLKVSDGPDTRTIPVDAIQWIESYDHYLKIHTDQDLFLRRDTMNGILDVLDDKFFRIHRKYIVNLDQAGHLSRENGNIYVVMNGHKLKVSNSYRDTIEKLFQFAN